MRGAMVVVLLALTGCAGSSGPTAPYERCVEAWDDGRGNAGAPGVEREAWVAECAAELEGGAR